MNEVTLSKRPVFHRHVHVYLCIWGGGGGENRPRVLFASVIGFSLEG